MSANYGRRLFTWDRLSFFVVSRTAIIAIAWSVCFFSTFLWLYFKSQLKELFFFLHSTALDCVLFGVFYQIGGSFYRIIPAPSREEKKNKKRGGKRQPGRLFRNGILPEFFYASALLFLSDANIGKWIKLEEYIHLDKAFFLLLFTYRSSRY